MSPPIVRLGHPVLRFPAAPVDLERLRVGDHTELMETMKGTLSSLGADSLAAPQMGAELQILVFRGGVLDEVGAGTKPKIVLNPMLEPEHGDLVYDWEACLSIPDLKGLVPRYPSVRLRGLDEEGELIDVMAKGRRARILQHAHDHLGGVVYLDRMGDLRSLAFGDEWRRFLRGSDSPDREQP